MPFQIVSLIMAGCILAHIHSWLQHILCKSSSKTSTSCHKPSVSPFVSSCITLHFHQQLKLVFWDFLLFKLVIFHFKQSIFICFQFIFHFITAPSVKLLPLLSYLFTGHAIYSFESVGVFFSCFRFVVVVLVVLQTGIDLCKGIIHKIAQPAIKSFLFTAHCLLAF